MPDINKKPGVGHNSSTEYVGGVEFLHSALEDAIQLVLKLTKRNHRIEKHLKSAVYAKNNLQRGLHLSKALEIESKNKKEVQHFDQVITAVNNREDIHSGYNKGAKLELCSETGNFGNYIANCTGGKAFDNYVVDKAFDEVRKEENTDE
jgi:hypothetical protein